MLEGCEGFWAADLELGEWRKVEHGYAFARGDVFCCDDGRPFASLPATT